MADTPHSYATDWWEMLGFWSKIYPTKDRAEAVLSTPAPALSEALTLPGVQHLMNHTLPLSHAFKHIWLCLQLAVA
jgi:hypothetical protein